MAVTETTHQQSPELHPDELKPSDDVSSSATGHDEPYEKTAEAEAGLSQPKPPAGPPEGPPPNGGLTAWLQVLGGFFLFFNTWVRISFRHFVDERAIRCPCNIAHSVTTTHGLRALC